MNHILQSLPVRTTGGYQLPLLCSVHLHDAFQRARRGASKKRTCKCVCMTAFPHRGAYPAKAIIIGVCARTSNLMTVAKSFITRAFVTILAKRPHINRRCTTLTTYPAIASTRALYVRLGPTMTRDTVPSATWIAKSTNASRTFQTVRAMQRALRNVFAAITLVTTVPHTVLIYTVLTWSLV